MTQAYLSIQHFDISLADTETTETVNISAGDTLKCTPLVTHRVGNTDESDVAADYLDVDFLTGPNRVRVTRGVGDGPMTIHLVVIEWDTTEVAIQTGTFSIADGDTDDDVPISAVTLAKTWMVMPFQRDTAAVALINTLTRGMITTTTNIHFERGGGGGGGQIDGHWWTIEDTNGGLWDVQRIVAGVATTTSDDFTISTVVMAKTFLVGTDEIVGGGNRAESVGVAELFSTTVVRYTRPTDFRDMEIDIYVVELLQSGDSVQRGSITLGSGTETDTATISPAVALDRSFANAPTRQSSATVDVDTYETALRAQIKLNSTTVVEVSAADDSTVSIVKWEVVELNEESVTPDEPAIIFGTNF